jgi:hypothetical protein
MDINVILQAITSVGFPIVMCIMLMYYIRETTAKHKEESDKFAEALNANTLVLQKLCDKLDENVE